MTYLALLEKLALRETGRKALATRRSSGLTMVVYPSQLGLSELLPAISPARGNTTYCLEYSRCRKMGRWTFRNYLVFVHRLLKRINACRRVEVMMFSRQSDWPFALTAAIVGRLKALPVALHDYGYHSQQGVRKRRMLFSFCRSIIVGDVTGVTGDTGCDWKTSFRSESVDCSPYRKMTKDRAIPRVIAVGDFNDPTIVSLIIRTHELIKQKYPRTEFLLVSPVMFAAADMFSKNGRNSILPKFPKSETELRAIYEESDVVMLLSPGGINRFFVRRAAAAGYPVITNGFEYPMPLSDRSRIIMAPRDSYSALAGETVRLVDDETYYRSFSRP